jgi:hypothetical protein
VTFQPAVAVKGEDRARQHGHAEAGRVSVVHRSAGRARAGRHARVQERVVESLDPIGDT